MAIRNYVLAAAAVVGGGYGVLHFDQAAKNMVQPVPSAQVQRLGYPENKFGDMSVLQFLPMKVP